jgi:outer membrane autotransporter protein
VQLRCEGIEINDIERAKYWKEDLEKLFIKYNECNNYNYTNYDPKQKKDLFHLSIRPGINYGSLEIQHNPADYRAADFGGSIGIRLGIETEFVLPFNKNKWGIIAEPTYQYYKTKVQEESSKVYGGILVTQVDYKSIELPIGMRHYFYLNDKSKLFVNVSFVYDFELKSSIKFLRNNNTLISDLEIKTKVNLALGMGYKYNNRYSIEIRYNTNREILSDYIQWQSKYKSLNVYFGLSVF